jgi:hypothetical protein
VQSRIRGRAETCSSSSSASAWGSESSQLVTDTKGLSESRRQRSRICDRRGLLGAHGRHASMVLPANGGGVGWTSSASWCRHGPHRARAGRTVESMPS